MGELQPDSPPPCGEGLGVGVLGLDAVTTDTPPGSAREERPTLPVKRRVLGLSPSNGPRTIDTAS